MGLFSRFRQPSNPTSSSSSRQHDRPSTPSSSQSPLDAPSRPSTSLGRSFSRLDLEDTAPTPRPKEKEKERERKFGWKGKSKADVGGRPYEEYHPRAESPVPPSRVMGAIHGSGSGTSMSERRNVSESGNAEKRITAIFTPSPSASGVPGNGNYDRNGPRSSTPSYERPNQNPGSPISPRSDRTVHSNSTERARSRPMSDEFAKDGGVLGRLTFEKPLAASTSIGDAGGSPRKDRKMREKVPSWLAGSGSEDNLPMVLGDRSGRGADGPPSAYVPPSVSAPAGMSGLYDRELPPPPVPSPPQKQQRAAHLDEPQNPQQSQQQRFPPVPQRKASIGQLPHVAIPPRNESAIADDDQEMVGEDLSAKRTRFWVGRGRRASRGDELDQATSGSRPTSPTPRKASQVANRPPVSPTPRNSSLPPRSYPTSPTRSPVVSDPPLPLPRANAPPPNLRRPSSSFFSNPFARTTSRQSIFTDIDVQPAQDDGSFQLKSFRHVSGMSEVDKVSSPVEAPGRGGRNTSVLGLTDTSTVSSPIAMDSEDKWDPVPPVRPAMLSRPSSSASVRTFDSADSPKVSVAAFKKGIRRPSESFPEGSKTALDDDDDVPLGVLNNKGFARAQSSLSLSDQADVPRPSPKLMPMPPALEINKPMPKPYLTPSPRVAQLSQPSSREASPNPSHHLSVGNGNGNVNSGGGSRGGHQRNGGGSGGFVVRSAQSSRSNVSIESQRGAGSPKVDSSRAASPLGEEREEVIYSPVGLAGLGPPNGGDYFGLKTNTAVLPSSGSLASPSVVSERNASVPVATPSHQSKPFIKDSSPVKLDDGPGLHDLILPPRPSELPDAPPHPQSPLPRSTSGQVSPIARPTDFSRRISSFLAPSPTATTGGIFAKAQEDAKEDGFDPALVVQSLAAFTDEPAPLPRTGRPSLQDRLGKAAGLVKPAGGMEQEDRAKGVKSPESDTTVTASSDLNRPTSSFIKPSGNAKAKKAKARTATAARGRTGKKDGWSSSESDEDEEEEEDGEEDDKTVEGAHSSIKVAGVRSPTSPALAHAALPTPTSTLPASSAAGASLPALPAITSQPKPVDLASEADSDSSSEEETLATVRARASRSALNADYRAGAQAAPAPGPPQGSRGVRSPSSPNLSLPPPSSFTKSHSSYRIVTPTPTRSSPLSPKKTGKPLELGSGQPKKTLSPPPLGPPSRRSPLSQSLSSTQLKRDAEAETDEDGHGELSPPRSSTTASASASASAVRTASPASSQSGLTGDSMLQPVTPRESSVGPSIKGKERMGSKGQDRNTGHGRTTSRDSSQPSNGPISSSTSMASMSPSTEERQRRFSQTSMPTLAPQLAPAAQAYPPNMDPAMIR
ncbi:uncharacterized protein MKK02DRAFT_43407 [Dioszegia hungarica]|uniref:Uncharacterized protein n=1 Tax=Dioszegia hungarica TaxID=4972 RepID=A0AA38LWC0_9TREE|nr:uncharacterized protein MKK02DRAFT_43407 [Dioszegia hungarica]KAI9637483.1 hypothetical protein MKK02DRAFT_43407 [Dioszegia hungarica]